MRKRITFSLEEDVIERLKEVSDKTMIPQARLVEVAIKEKLEEMKSKEA